MSTEMSNATIGCYEAELLPARTVLSVSAAGLHDALGGSNGADGTEGNDGGTGHAKGLGLFGWLQQGASVDPDTAVAGTDGVAGANAPS
jgi:hypothetical protein